MIIEANRRALRKIEADGLLYLIPFQLLSLSPSLVPPSPTPWFLGFSADGYVPPKLQYHLSHSASASKLNELNSLPIESHSEFQPTKDGNNQQSKKIHSKSDWSIRLLISRNISGREVFWMHSQTDEHRSNHKDIEFQCDAVGLNDTHQREAAQQNKIAKGKQQFDNRMEIDEGFPLLISVDRMALPMTSPQSK